MGDRVGEDRGTSIPSRDPVGPARTLLRAGAGLVVAGLLLWLLFRDTDWPRVGAALAEVRVGWLLVAQALLWASCFARVQRWAYVVRAVAPASYRAMLAATQIGFLVNLTVPARVGELARGYVLKRLTGIPFARGLATIAVDRVADLLGLLAVLLVTAVAMGSASVELPPGSLGNTATLTISSDVVGPASLALVGIVLGATGGLVALFAARETLLGLLRALLRPFPRRLGEFGLRAASGFAEGMGVFRSAGDLLRCALWSLPTWGAQVLAIAAIVAAFGIDAPWVASFLMMALISVFISVPIAPGMIGQYHVAAAAGLLLAAPGASPAEAKAVALVTHASSVVPIAALGLYFLLRERLGLLSLARASAREGDPPG